MIRFLRHSRLLAIILLLATPALGGAWLQAAHPCPVDSPWLAAQTGSHGAHGEHGSEPGAGCHCVGSCAGAAVAVLAPATALSTAAAPAPTARPHIAWGAPAPAPLPSDRLPPATAPPLV